MQPTGRFLINITGDKSLYLWNGTEVYFDKLRRAYSDIINDNNSEYLYFGFFTLCAATLEYSLNYILVNHCIDTFGVDKYRAKSKRYLSINFKEKLLKVTSIVSNGEYISNEENISFKYLEELISLRNKMLHNKEFLNEFNLPINGREEGGNLIIPIDKMKIEFEIKNPKNLMDNLTKEKCINYGNALGDFKKYIMTPILIYELTENLMVKKAMEQ